MAVQIIEKTHLTLPILRHRRYSDHCWSVYRAPE
jgi:hypothetical protein